MGQSVQEPIRRTRFVLMLKLRKLIAGWVYGELEK